MNWERENAERLSNQWRLVEGRLVMIGACPGCGHPKAFRHIHVDARGVIPADVVADERMPDISDFPPTAVVDCVCEHSAHGDETGCGRSGPVKIKLADA